MFTAALALVVLAAPAALANHTACSRCLYLTDDGAELFVGSPGEDIGSTSNAGLFMRMADATLVHHVRQGGAIDGFTAPGTAESNDKFGSTMVAGDFNGDGTQDIAAGVPYEDVGSLVDAGIVIVFYGDPTGNDEFASTEVIYQSRGASGTLESGDMFGYSLAAYRFGTGDAYDDLIVGVPGEDLGSTVDAGVVQIVRGGPSGLSGSQTIHQDTPGVAGVAEADDHFGYSVTAAPIGDEYYGALIVGVPFEDIGSTTDAGAVQVFYAGSDGTIGTQNQAAFYQGNSGVAGSPEAGDRFGEVLASGNYGSGYIDVAVGAPYEDIGADANAGIVHVLNGDFDGLTGSGHTYYQGAGGVAGLAEPGDHFGAALVFIPSSGNSLLAIGAPGENIGSIVDAGLVHIVKSFDDVGLRTIHQGTSGIIDSNEAGDEFGAALTVTDRNGDTAADLVIGGPGENNDAGQIWVLLGTASNGITSTDAAFTQGDGIFPGTHEAGDRFGEVLLGEAPWT